jgi:hypothetical protein
MTGVPKSSAQQTRRELLIGSACHCYGSDAVVNICTRVSHFTKSP